MTKAFDTWKERLDTGRLTKGQIQQFAAVVSRQATGLGRQGKASALTYSECEILATRIYRNPVLLTTEHTEQGLTWLDRYGRKVFRLTEAEHADLIAGFRHFTWAGEIEGIETSGYIIPSVPIWHVHLNDGREFAYYYASGWRNQRAHDGELWEVTHAAR